MRISEIAEAVRGEVEGGDLSAQVTGLAGLQDAEPGDISFLANPRYASALASTRATAVLVARDWAGCAPCALIRVESPDAGFAEVARLLSRPAVEYAPGIHPTAVVADGVELGDGVTVGPNCVLEPGVRVGARTVLCAGCYIGHGTSVGQDCRFYPHVSTREFTKIGDRVIIHNGAVIGSDGFGYVREKQGWTKIPQMGVVTIGDDVEIGANTTLDRARFGKTVIGNGVKIDNLVQIAHNVRIGAGTAVAAQVGVSGSTTMGEHVQLGGQAGLAGHLRIGEGAVVGAQAGVTKDVPPGTFVSGYPAMPHRKAQRMHAGVMRLPELKKRVEALERKLSEMTQADAGSS